MKTITTDRIYFRPLTEDDATQTYADWLNDPDVNAYLETRHTVQTIDDCKAFISTCNNDPSSHLFGLFLHDGDKHFGNAKLGAINQHHLRGQLSLFIGDKTQWGKGLASEIIAALTEYGFTKLGLERIESGCYEDNVAAVKACLQVGYSIDGFLRKHVLTEGRRSGCYWLAILKDDPRPS